MKIAHTAPRSVKKALREQRLNSIVVTVERADGTLLQFDGDEESQKRLDRFSRSMNATCRETIPWVLADNTMADVTADELEQALDLAMRKQGELWFL